MPQASPAAMIDPVDVPPIRSKYSESTKSCLPLRCFSMFSIALRYSRVRMPRMPPPSSERIRFGAVVGSKCCCLLRAIGVSLGDDDHCSLGKRVSLLENGDPVWPVRSTSFSSSVAALWFVCLYKYCERHIPPGREPPIAIWYSGPTAQPQREQ